MGWQLGLSVVVGRTVVPALVEIEPVSHGANEISDRKIPLRDWQTFAGTLGQFGAAHSKLQTPYSDCESRMGAGTDKAKQAGLGGAGGRHPPRAPALDVCYDGRTFCNADPGSYFCREPLRSRCGRLEQSRWQSIQAGDQSQNRGWTANSSYNHASFRVN